MENEDEGFQDYVVTSMDPGSSMMVATLLFCVLMVAALPCLVMVGRRFQKHEENPEETDSSAHDDEATDEQTGKAPEKLQPKPIATEVSSPYPIRHNDPSDDESDVDSIFSDRTGISSVASAFVNAILDAGGPSKHNPARVVQKQQTVEHEFADEKYDNDEDSILGRISMGEVSFRDAVDAQENMFKEAAAAQEPPNLGPWYSCSRIGANYDNLLAIAEADYETRRICRLGVPFVGQAVLEGVSETVRVALIGNFVGTKALSAYVIVDLMAGLTTDFIGGFQEALTTLCSHAVGAGNRKLAGQYVQIAATLFTACNIPIFLFWIFLIGPTIRWFGYDEETVKIGEDYILLYLFDSYLEGMDDCVHSLLDVIGLASYSTWFILAQEIVETVVTAVIVTQTGVKDLQLIGISWIAAGAFFLILNVSIVVWNGWFDKYLEGLVGGFALLVS